LVCFSQYQPCLPLNAVDAPPIIRLGIFFPLMVASVGFVQSRSKFCLAYGFAGTHNVGKMGLTLNALQARKTELQIARPRS
jgi:hypothetical protein